MKKSILSGILGVLHDIRRWICSLVVVGLLFGTAGCYGSFKLTNIVYDVNGQVRPGLLRQVTFWVFLIIPVYEVAVLGDIVILNLIEFWTGADFGGFSRSGEADNLEFVMTPAEDGRTADLTVRRDNETVARATFVRISDDVCEARSPKGRLLAKAVRTDDGKLCLQDAEGNSIATLSPEKLKSMKMTANQEG